ncbi:MAG TPA: ubiquinol oxidase subunit II [Sphingomonas sp.]|jgi:cytochrome o ubiquinol oxidase subunit 2|uniref:ubiquinol oxidase subunit II n=1 Tax=Sphingomonas sp. TaxID=28214 RepID=UPI002EDA1B4B
MPGLIRGGVWARAGVCAPVAALAGCGEMGLLDPAGPVAAGERAMFFNAVVIMLAIIVPIIVLTLYFAWRYSAKRPRGQYTPDWSYSGRLELLVWSIPALVIIFLGGIAWIGSHELEPSRPLRSPVRALPVQVISLDWKWLFIYPEQGLASVNRLVIPAGTPISFRITSGTVMNSFMVPRLGSQMYAMAGMDGKLNLQADKPGRYRGLSAHYSGEGFSEMAFFADAVTPAEFAAWVARTRRAGPVLDAPGYLKIERQAATSKPYTYRAVAPGLYEAALKQSGVRASEEQRSGREDTE